MSLNAATVCVAREISLGARKIDNAGGDAQNEHRLPGTTLGTGNKHVLNAEEELLHFQNTDK